MANLRPRLMGSEFDLARDSLRDVNLFLHKHAFGAAASPIHIRIPTVRIPSHAVSMPSWTCRFTATSAITWRA